MWRILREVVRNGQLSEALPDAACEWRREGQQIQHEILRVLGRALAIREVDAGSCNGCELEIHARLSERGLHLSREDRRALADYHNSRPTTTRMA